MKKNSSSQVFDALYNYMYIQSPKQDHYNGFVAAAQSGPHVIVVSDLNEAKNLRRSYKFPHKTAWVSLNNLKKLRGVIYPVLFSPGAMRNLLGMALDDSYALQEVRDFVAH